MSLLKISSFFVVFFYEFPSPIQVPSQSLPVSPQPSPVDPTRMGMTTTIPTKGGAPMELATTRRNPSSGTKRARVIGTIIGVGLLSTLVVPISIAVACVVLVRRKAAVPKVISALGMENAATPNIPTSVMALFLQWILTSSMLQ